MKTSLIELLLVIPAILFLDWVIMVVVGFISNIFGANDDFFCTIYSDFGIALLVISFLFVAYLIINQNLHHKVQA